MNVDSILAWVVHNRSNNVEPDFHAITLNHILKKAGVNFETPGVEILLEAIELRARWFSVRGLNAAMTCGPIVKSWPPRFLQAMRAVSEAMCEAMKRRPMDFDDKAVFNIMFRLLKYDIHHSELIALLCDRALTVKFRNMDDVAKVLSSMHAFRYYHQGLVDRTCDSALGLMANGESCSVLSLERITGALTFFNHGNDAFVAALERSAGKKTATSDFLYYGQRGDDDEIERTSL
jgi:hypothetical protein